MRPYVLCVSPAIKLTLKVGYICPFVVIDPTNLGATMELLFQDLCLSILKLSPTQNACLFTDGNKASCLIITRMMMTTTTTTATMMMMTTMIVTWACERIAGDCVRRGGRRGDADGRGRRGAARAAAAGPEPAAGVVIMIVSMLLLMRMIGLNGNPPPVLSGAQRADKIVFIFGQKLKTELFPKP